jgi:DNA invertase Pin-like site-specific DNA recombinase
MARAYCERHGLTLDLSVTYEDLGVSAWTGENRTAGMLGAFLQAVKDGTVKRGSKLLVEQLDRVSRQTARRAARALEDIVEAGVSVVTLDDEKEYTAAMLDDPLTFITVVLSFMRAHDESLQKSRRVRAAWTARKAKAKAKATGFVIAEMAPGWIKRDTDGRFALTPGHAGTVKRMAELFLSGMGFHSIARTFNVEQVLCFSGGRQWFDEGIRRVLDNPAIAGILDVAGAENVEGYYPAAVSMDQWRDIQALRVGRRLPNQRVRMELVNPLAGLARCVLCGGALTRKATGANAGHQRLVCQTAKVGKGCEYHSFRLDHVEAALRRDLPLVLSEAPAGNDEMDAEIWELRSQLEGIGDELERLVDAIRAQGHSATISEALTALERTKKETEARLQDASERASSTTPAAIERRRGELADCLDNPDATAGDLNVKLRGVFEAVVPDHRTGCMALRWIGGQACDREVMFAWREAED